MKLILACLAVIGPVGSAMATEAAYHCTDRTKVHAVFSPPGPKGFVRLSFAGKGATVELPEVQSADGARYKDESFEFWVKGKTARLTRLTATTECKTK